MADQLRLQRVSQELNLPPTVLTIFGSTGDLSLNQLLPTLVHMDNEGLLPKNFRLVCVGRREFDTKAFISFFVKNSRAKLDAKAVAKFAQRIIYFKGDIDEPNSFSELQHVIADHKIGKKHDCFSRLYYFATAPEYFAPIASILKHQGLLIGCGEHERTIRILVEKPFGVDLKSAQTLNKELLKFFTEKQIYRIDHYLGKETVQNLLVTRFANDFLEPIWNRDYIDHVELSVFEDVGVGNRLNFFDQTGTLKDLVQNHIVQMLALIAMEEPKDITPESIRTDKLGVLNALKKFTAKTISGNVVRGQYKEYKGEVGKRTETETFVALKTFVQNKRWNSVPFYIKTGKRLGKKVTEISVHFKKQCNLFGTDRASNVLTLRIQPDESVQLQINNKVPGFGIRLHTGSLDFGYKTAFLTEIPSAYERLFLDFMQGDQRLFMSKEEIEAAWKFTDSIVSNWDNKNAPIQTYASGSAGPKQAEAMIARDGHKWWTH